MSETQSFNVSSLPPVVQTLWGAGAEAAEKYNTLASQKDAATGDVEKAKKAATVKLPEITAPAELAKQYEQIKAAAEKYNANVANHFDAQVKTLSPEQISKLDAEMGAAKKLYVECRNFVKSQAAEAVAHFPQLSTGRSSGGAGRGAGGAKIRNVQVFVDGELATMKSKDSDGNEVNRSTITAGAAKLGIAAGNLQSKYLFEAKTSDWREAPDVVEFTLSKEDGVSHLVKIVRVHKPEEQEQAA